MEISFSKIVNQTKEIILDPKEFWKNQKKESVSQVKLLSGWFLPLLAVVAIAVFLGEFVKRSDFFIEYSVLKAAREVTLFVLQYFISVFFTNALIKTFGGKKNIEAVRKLVVYSITPFLLVSIITGLIPFLYVVDILGLYSFYLFWIGAGELLQIPESRKNSYILITIVVNFFVFSFLSILLSKLLVAFY